MAQNNDRWPKTMSAGAFALCTNRLVKLTLVVNSINILQAAFELISFYQKITKPNCNERKAVQSTFL